MDSVSSYRTLGYSKFLIEFGIFPTLLTHKWEKGQKGWMVHDKSGAPEIEAYDTHNEIRLPFPGTDVTNKFQTISNWLSGNFDQHVLSSYNVFKTFLFKHLKNNTYDCVISIFSPHYHLKLAYQVSKEFKIPYVLDFRDLWNNQVICKSYSPTFKERVQNIIIRFYWKRWLQNALFTTTTGNKWAAFLSNLSNRPCYVIANGHEYTEMPIQKENDKFILTYFGRIYPYQSMNTIISGIEKFIEKITPIKFEIHLIGIKSVGNFNGKDIFLSNKIINPYVKVFEYMPKDELIQFCQVNTSIFLLPNLIEDNGSFFVKLYDYIGFGKPVLLAPRNGSENDDLLEALGDNLVTSSVDEVYNYIDNYYVKFIKGEKSDFRLDWNKVMRYNRRNQVKLFSERLKEQINW
jgi:glycosyltransferase involved in cell wall biosynthesis